MLRALLLFAALVAGCASQQAAKPYPPVLQPEEVSAAIENVLAQAAAEDKLALLVLGANWCHDSTDFVAMLEEPALSDWLEQYYVIALFNLGYVEQVAPYLQPFEVPAVYGTPTVLVVEPDSRRVRNRETHYFWRNASQLDAAQARDYFDDYLAAPPEAAPVSANLAAAMVKIDRFEAAQAQRIFVAYRALAPLMRAYDAGQPAADFEEKWVNLARMRGQITTDLAALRVSAREQDAAGIAPVVLEFPEYSLFIDP